MALKKKDFVEVEYTGKLKESGEVFDTTSEKVAKESGIFSEKAEYTPVIICLGERHIIQGIDEFLEGKDLGKHNLELPAERAFGKKDAKLIRMIPTNKFLSQNIRPIPGLRVNINNLIGIVRAVTGGRTVVDFNHPLAGRDVVYELEVKRVVTDKKEKVQSLLRILLGVTDGKVEISDNTAKITLPQLPDQIKTEFSKKVEELTGLKVSYVEEKPAEKPAEKKAEPEKKEEKPAK